MRISKRLTALIVSCVAALSVVGLVPLNASAFSARLPAYTATASGPEYYMGSLLGSEDVSYGEICIGPADWNGKNYTWPYGYKCVTNVDSFNFPYVTAHIGIYNPLNRTANDEAEVG